MVLLWAPRNVSLLVATEHGAPFVRLATRNCQHPGRCTLSRPLCCCQRPLDAHMCWHLHKCALGAPAQSSKAHAPPPALLGARTLRCTKDCYTRLGRREMCDREPTLPLTRLVVASLSPAVLTGRQNKTKFSCGVFPHAPIDRTHRPTSNHNTTSREVDASRAPS